MTRTTWTCPSCGNDTFRAYGNHEARTVDRMECQVCGLETLLSDGRVVV